MPPAVNLTGRRFGRLTAIRATDERRCGKVVWSCLCDPDRGGCGRTVGVPSTALLHKGQVSCGCRRVQEAAKRQAGRTPTPERRRRKSCRRCRRPYAGIGRQRYCSPRCRRAARLAAQTTARGLTPCSFCGRPVGGARPRKYCSGKCHDRAAVVRRNAARWRKICEELGDIGWEAECAP
jgi:hypothetical protein